MPVYSITSPETGRSYQVNIDGQPDGEDIDSIWPQLDAHAAQREAEKPFFGVGDTLSGIGSAIGGLTETLPASYYRLTEGLKRPDQYSPEARAAFDAEQKFTQQVQQESQNRLMRGEATSAGNALREAAPSLGFSAVTMGASLLGKSVGRPLGAVVGGVISAPTGPGAVGGAGLGATIGDTVAGMAASGYTAYRMAGNQFLDQAFQRIGEQRAKEGKPWGEQEKLAAYNDLLPLAQNTGLWEAGPEAVGNALGLVAGKYVLGFGKKAAGELVDSIWKTTGKKVAAAAGGLASEVGTETITQLGAAPAQAQADALASGNPNWRNVPSPYAAPGGVMQAIADVAPATLAQSALMLGAGGVAKGTMAAANRMRGQASQSPNASVNDRTAPMPPADQTVPDAGNGAGSTPAAGASVSPLPGIAQRAGTVDVPPLVPGLEAEDLGPLTAADVQDMGTIGQGDNQMPQRQPILGGVPDRVAPQPDNQTVGQGDNEMPGPDVPAPDSQLDGLRTQEVPVSALRLSKDVPQFKSDADEETGVVEPLAGKYQRLGTGPILVWERLDGSREVISGRHRFDLAKRTGEQTIPAQVVREADGFTVQMAVTADAELNIRDGHGKTKDFANYFRASGTTDTEAESRGLLARAAGKTGWAIGTQGSQELFDLHQNGRLTDAQAAAVARTAPGNEALQRAGIAALNRGTPIDVTVNLMRALELQTGPAPTADQLDLFGADDSMMLRMEEQAKKATEIQRGLKEQVAAVQGAAKRPEQARKLGVNVKDPEGVRKRVDELKALLYRWESWPLHADLRVQVTGETQAPAEGVGQPMSEAPFSPSPSLPVSLSSPTSTTTTAAATRPAAAPAATTGRGEGGTGGAGSGALLDVAPSTRPRNRGETAKPQREDVLAELGQATREGAANQAQGTLGFQNLDTSGRTAGFLNTEILAEAEALVRRGITDFTNWSRAMLTRFGRGIRDYLQGIWAQITSPQTNAAQNVRLGMPQGTAPVSVGSGGFIPNPLHKQGDAFRVKAQVGRALLTGSPLPKDFTKVLDATDNERRAVDQTAAIVGRDLDAAVKAHAKRTGKPLADVWAMVEPVMTGQPGALAVLRTLDANLGERARRARNLLDDLSTAVARTMPAGEMRNTILGNLGQWMRRGYAAFDPESGWSFDKVTAAAKAGKLIAGKDAALILANARAYLQAQNPGATAAEIEADMRDLMDRDTWQSALLGGTVKKAVGSLMRRKDIAPEIRALMGEETNPLHRYLQSAKFQAQLIARHHGQVAMRTIGLATGLLKPARGGVYTVEIPKEGYRWSGLGGTFTTPELMQALENSSGILQDGNTWGGWLVKTLKALGNEAKLNRVAMNPDSWLVNVIGGFMSTVQTGDIFATGLMKAFKQKPTAADRSFGSRAKQAAGIIGSAGSMQGIPFRRVPIMANALQDQQREMLARLTQQGVIGSSITLADIEASMPRHLLQWVAENETRDRALGAAQGALIGQAMGRGLGLPGRAAGGAIGAVGGALAGTQNLQKWRQKVAEWTMTKPDNLFRVTGWLTNYETALAAGMQPDAAAKWASERTLNTFPNYNALPAVLREFSKLGLVGSFIAFQHEVYRNTYWNIRYALREVGSGNSALQARGLQRLAGLSSIAALTFGGGLAYLLGMSGAAGADDERNKLFRKWFAAPWERDAVLAFDKFTPESVSYMNTSYLLPQVTLQELAQAASEGASEGEAVQRVMSRLWEQFAGSSVHLSPIIAATFNIDRNNRPITNRPGVAGALERVDSAVMTIGEPGFADKMTRILYALREAERRGRKFSVEQEMKRLFGLRGYERTWDTLVKSRYSRFGSEYQAIRDDANRVLGENLPGAQVRAVEEANARIAELDKQRVQFEADMQRLGIAPLVVRSAQKESAFNKLNPVRLRADGKRVEAVTARQ